MLRQACLNQYVRCNLISPGLFEHQSCASDPDQRQVELTFTHPFVVQLMSLGMTGLVQNTGPLQGVPTLLVTAICSPLSQSLLRSLLRSFLCSFSLFLLCSLLRSFSRSLVATRHASDRGPSPVVLHSGVQGGAASFH